ncbi:carbon-nitrogen hydrolase family protein [Endozoicomonas atrinae]|uniref:carbon-nitrogen hydrolase family protein n=1 Tax=Endozoicomonas atrinae TaxID=1333660 RepID=UPI003B00CC8D
MKLGVSVCFDIWFPELMRGYQEVDVILHPANFGGQQSFSIAQARALENGQHILTCNRVGKDITSEFTANYCGGSRVYNPRGEELLRLCETQSINTIAIEDLTLAPQYNGIDLQDEINEIRNILA